VTVAALVGISTDYLVVAHVCGSVDVARYDVVYKLSSLTLFIGYFAAPLWPAFSEAQTRGDARWLRTAFRRTSGLAALLAGVICLMLFLFGRDVVRLWAGQAVVPSLSLLAGFCFYRFCAGASEAAIPLLNTAPLLHVHVLIASGAAIVALVSKIVAAKYAGVEGVIWATGASYALFFYLPAVIIAYRWSARFWRRTPVQLDEPVANTVGGQTPERQSRGSAK
jgi:O-antigen/teichoic acid export membrane protein